MKKLIDILVLAIVMVCGLCIGATMNASATNYETCDLYAKATVVVEVDYEYNLVYCKDFNGEVWCFSGCEDWVVGDIASLLMYNNGTKIIYDDEIVNPYYNGWFDGWKW